MKIAAKPSYFLERVDASAWLHCYSPKTTRLGHMKLTQRLVELVSARRGRPYGSNPLGNAKLLTERGVATVLPNLFSGRLIGPRGRMRTSVDFGVFLLLYTQSA
uniref:HP2 n=1 Tax=Agave tequilana deltaflexivirus 1 TaxID=2794415 RepID=A0A7T5QZB8_9VIRU|nr:HP2 [Agave tequilana deltaflexivirus 1]